MLCYVIHTDRPSCYTSLDFCPYKSQMISNHSNNQHELEWSNNTLLELIYQSVNQVNSSSNRTETLREPKTVLKYCICV